MFFNFLGTMFGAMLDMLTDRWSILYGKFFWNEDWKREIWEYLLYNLITFQISERANFC